MEPIISGLLGAAILAILAVLANATQRRASIDVDGWKQLRPSWLNVGTTITAAGGSGLFAYFLIMGGSALVDARRQNTIAFIICIVLGVFAIYNIWVIRFRKVMWRGDVIRVLYIFGREEGYRISSIRLMQKSVWRSGRRLIFEDGTTLWVPAYFHGFRELLDKVPMRARPSSK